VAAHRAANGLTARLLVRAEREGDRSAIREVIASAFDGMPYADGDEAELVDRLRSARALSVSLVAEVNETIVGQIALSPAYPSDGCGGWYALGPVSVLPSHQRSGIGGKLVRAGLRAIVELGAVGCMLTGDPDYYARFGFSLAPSNAPDNEPAEYFMVKLVGGPIPIGAIRFHTAFYG